MLWEGEIEQPLLEEGEIIYIPKLDIETTVTKRVRDVEGGRIYYTNYIVEEIEDEESKVKAKEDQEEEKKRMIECVEELRKKREKESKVHVEEVEDSPKEEVYEKKWYQFWK